MPNLGIRQTFKEENGEVCQLDNQKLLLSDTFPFPYSLDDFLFPLPISVMDSWLSSMRYRSSLGVGSTVLKDVKMQFGRGGERKWAKMHLEFHALLAPSSVSSMAEQSTVTLKTIESGTTRVSKNFGK